MQADDDTVLRGENKPVAPEDDADLRDPLDEEDMWWGLNAIEVGLTKVSEQMPNHGATAAENLKDHGATAAEKLKDIGATAADKMKDLGATAAENLKDHGATAAEKLKDHGATAAKSMEKVAKSMEKATKYVANVAVLITLMVLTSRHLKHGK
jgi:ElaB/YqjD/DUF883 family membrane-anchored ribosome-binding protein